LTEIAMKGRFLVLQTVYSSFQTLFVRTFSGV